MVDNLNKFNIEVISGTVDKLQIVFSGVKEQFPPPFCQFLLF